MSRPRGVRRLFRIRRRGWIQEAVDAELEHHIEMRVDELVEAGMRPDEARRVAEDAFGDRKRYRSACVAEQRREARMTWTRELFGSVGGDVRHALRGIRKAPGFALAVVLTLGLGIGANAAIFTVVDTLLIRDLPYPRPDELHQVHARLRDGFTLPDFRTETALALTEAPAGLAAVHLSGRLGAVRNDGPEPVTLFIEALEPGFTDMLGMAPASGRPFNRDDAVPGAAPVALLSHGFWMGALGGDPEAIGRILVLDSVSVTVVGVMPRAFRYPLFGRTDLYLPLAADGTALGRDVRSLAVTLRVAEGDLARVTGAAESFAQGYLERTAATTTWTPTLARMNDRRASRDVTQALYVTFGAVTLMLLVALVNGINLTLVRGTARAREIGVRLALGAGRRRIVGQLLTESVVLAVLSGALAVALATVGVDALWAMAPRDLTFFAPEEVRVDGRILWFTGLVSVAAALGFGLVPAVRSVTAADATSSATIGAHGNQSRRRHASRALLVVTQVALSLTLLFGAGLMGRSFQRLVAQDPGMEIEGLVSMDIELSPGRYESTDARAAFASRVHERLQGLPGVESVTAGHGGLPSTGITFTQGFHLEGSAEPIAPLELVIPMAEGDATLRATLGTELLAGRDFDANDHASDRRVLVTQSLARSLGAGSPPDALGIRFMLEAESTVYEVIGVIEDARLEGLDPMFAREAFFRLDDPTTPGQMVGFLLRASGPVAPLMEAARRVVREIDPGQPIAYIGEVDDGLRRSVQKPRFFMTLMTIFAGLALTLAAVGLYGVLSFTVSQRSREMGIRMALGAAVGDVRGMVLRSGLRMTLLGALLGIGAALWASRALQGLLFETSARDTLTLALTTLALLSVAVVASWIPARRATRVDPVRVLGAE